MDVNKLKKIENEVRIGGKGSMRRKHKHVQNSPAVEEKRFQMALAKLPLNQLPGIHQIIFEMRDSSEIVVLMPKVQGSVTSSVYVMTGDVFRNPPTSSSFLSKERKKEQKKQQQKLQREIERERERERQQLQQQQQQQQKSCQEIKQQKPLAAKKPKKPRQRLRYRNKKAQQMLAMAEEAGKAFALNRQEEDPKAGGDSLEASQYNGGDDDRDISALLDNLLELGSSSNPNNLGGVSGGGFLLGRLPVGDDAGSSLDYGETESIQSDNTKVPSDDSDFDQTIVGDNESLGSWCVDGDDDDESENNQGSGGGGGGGGGGVGGAVNQTIDIDESYALPPLVSIWYETDDFVFEDEE
ncbi:tol-Pal system protein TolA-like [Drosophila eugracilis]|uniref:tol-Pal system protein TolA-like n=1 Tax=Drosophila eugracilis TaxID=29029 RepID=UPI0007E85A1D|nr:tol-Pal system protein TolA-like [Drosophila eugracilis]XP_017063588.1 tol-Pal system protein TolA-like [Drosophila eugracilis]